MTVEALVKRLESIGFLCDVDVFREERDTRLIVRKLRSTPGNYIERNFITTKLVVDGKKQTIELDGAAPLIWFRPDGIEFFVCVTVGGRSPGAYEKSFREPTEVYEEVLHYFFDPDSRMSLEPDFVPGPGRPPGA